MDKKSVQFFIGTSGWSYDGWRGDFYPGGLPKARWFDFYAQHFNAVEVNATFYRTFKDETYRKWRDQALAGFRYALKAPRLITHRKMLMDVSDEIRIFAESAHILGETLGMILMQLAPGMPLDLPRLRAALSAFLDTSEVAVEFRHERWDSAETINLLREMRATWVCADSPKNPLRERLTGKNAYVRLHGRRQWYADNYSEDELRDIARIARNLAAGGASEVYIFLNNDIGGYAHRNALALREMMGV